jgi:hypothetical protein
MPSIPRAQQAGFVYHVINRGNGRATIFHKPQDYQAFLSIAAGVMLVINAYVTGQDPMHKSAQKLVMRSFNQKAKAASERKQTS